jgi:hypothetical protein
MAEFYNENLLQRNIEEIKRKQRDMDLFASLNPQADARSGGVAKEEAESNWLQQQIKEMTPQTIYDDLIQREWKDRKVPGKILMALGELARGASQRSKYVPFGERMRGQAQAEYDSRVKALTGLERIMSADRRTEMAVAQREAAAREATDLRRELGLSKTEIDKFRADTERMRAEGQVDRWVKQLVLDERKLSMEEKQAIWNSKAEDSEELIVRAVQDDPEWITADQEKREKIIGRIADALESQKKLVAQAQRSWRPRTQWREGGNTYWYDPRTGDHGFGKMGGTWDPDTGLFQRRHPNDPGKPAEGLMTMDKEHYDSWRDFAKTAGQARIGLGSLANLAQRDANITGFWDTGFGRQFRLSINEVMPDSKMGLSPEEALSDTSIVNAALMHSSAQVGIRPPMILVDKLAESIGASPGGSAEAKLKSVAAFVLLSEYSELAEIAPFHGDDAKNWPVDSPWFGAAVRKAVEDYVAQVRAGNPNARLQSMHELLGLPHYYGRKLKTPPGFSGREVPAPTGEDDEAFNLLNNM